MRTINMIVVHCSATKENLIYGISITDYHLFSRLLRCMDHIRLELIHQHHILLQHGTTNPELQ